MVRRGRRAGALTLLALVGATACLRSSASISGSFQASFYEGFRPAVASDGSLWYGLGKDLVRLDLNRTTRTFPLATGSVAANDRLLALGLVPSTAGMVWFVATFVSPPGPSPEPVATFVGRVGPRGAIARRLLPASDDLPADALGWGTDGALWAHEIRLAGTTRTDDLLREDVNGGVTRFPVFPSSIVTGHDGRVWVVQTGRSGTQVLQVGPSGVLSASSVPSEGSTLLPRPDGSVGLVAEAAQKDVCVVGSIDAAGDVHVDQAAPLIDNTQRPPLYGGGYGCFGRYGGADGSIWVGERPEAHPHGGEGPAPPWHVFRVSPGGARQQWTLPSGDFVETMAPAPHDAMWFVTGRRHELGVIREDGSISEGVAGVPASAVPAGDLPPEALLLPTGRTTLYLVAEGPGATAAVRVVTVATE